MPAPAVRAERLPRPPRTPPTVPGRGRSACGLRGGVGSGRGEARLGSARLGSVRLTAHGAGLVSPCEVGGTVRACSAAPSGQPRTGRTTTHRAAPAGGLRRTRRTVPASPARAKLAAPCEPAAPHRAGNLAPAEQPRTVRHRTAGPIGRDARCRSRQSVRGWRHRASLQRRAERATSRRPNNHAPCGQNTVQTERAGAPPRASAPRRRPAPPRVSAGRAPCPRSGRAPRDCRGR